MLLLSSHCWIRLPSQSTALMKMLLLPAEHFDLYPPAEPAGWILYDSVEHEKYGQHFTRDVG